MGFKINITGDVNKIFKEKTRTLFDKIQDEVVAFGMNTVNDAKRLTPVDEGHLRQSITATFPIDKKGFYVEIVVAADYGAYIEYGTGPFAAKYIATLPKEWAVFAAKFKGPGGGTYDEFIMRIFKWIKRKGLTLNPSSENSSDSPNGRAPRKAKKQSKEEGQQQLAYMIVKKILRDGIKQQPFLFPAVQKNRIELLKRLKALR